MDPETGKEVYVPMSDMLPMVHPDDFVIGGWDISGVEMDKAMGRAKVLEWDLQRQVGEYMKGVKPMPSIYCRFGLVSFRGCRDRSQQACARWVGVTCG